MKSIISLVAMLVLVSLAACQSPPAAPLASTPPRTLTPETSAPDTPTATAKPTETPDPNRPVGATGKDSEERWIKTENGKTYYFLPEVFGNQEFESRMKNGPINLTGYGDSMFNDFTLNFNDFIVKDYEYAANAKYLVHPPGPSDFVTKEVQYGSLASRISDDLFLPDTELNSKIVTKKYDNFKSQQDYEHYFSDVNAALRDYSNGKTIDVNGSAWEPRKGYDAYWINGADAKKDPSMYFANDLYSKVTVVDGKLVAVLAASGPLTDEDFRKMVLAPLQAVIEGKTEKIWWMEYQFFGAITGTTVSTGGKTITTVTIDLVP